MSHYHRCTKKLANYASTGARCQEIIAVCDGDSCPQDGEEMFCSQHMPEDSPHYVAPTPPLKR